MRAYVTGGTGFVGSNIVKVFSERHGAGVHCPVHRFVPADDASGFTTERLDLLDDAAVQASVGAFGPDVIVHSMILNDFAAMYADRDLAWRSYVGTTETLALAADAVGAKLILVSTDWVFDGTQSGADELGKRAQRVVESDCAFAGELHHRLSMLAALMIRSVATLDAIIGIAVDCTHNVADDAAERTQSTMLRCAACISGGARAKVTGAGEWPSTDGRDRHDQIV